MSRMTTAGSPAGSSACDPMPPRANATDSHASSAIDIGARRCIEQFTLPSRYTAPQIGRPLSRIVCASAGVGEVRRRIDSLATAQHLSCVVGEICDPVRRYKVAQIPQRHWLGQLMDRSNPDGDALAHSAKYASNSLRGQRGPSAISTPERRGRADLNAGNIEPKTRSAAILASRSVSRAAEAIRAGLS